MAGVRGRSCSLGSPRFNGVRGAISGPFHDTDAVLSVRVDPGHPRRLDNLAPRPALDRPSVMADSRRHFPPPWTVEDKDAYFIVRDHNGRALAYVYAEDKRTGAKPLTRDEARRIAANVAKLTELLGKG